MSDQAVTGGGVRHVAWLYQTPGEYLSGLRGFLAAGISAAEPTLVAIPSGRLPSGWLSAPADGVRTVNATGLGRNPARLMPAVRAFADEHAGRRVRVICQLAWAGRSAAELGEVARYEMMVNRAFASTPITMLCPYDAAELPRSVISAACASHPWLRQDGRDHTNGDYRDGHDPQLHPEPPTPVPPGAHAMSYRNDLRPVRALVAAEADRAGLSGSRRTDLVIAASEVAANTIKHTASAGLVRIWITSDEILCQFDDSGHIEDALAGYARPAGDEPGGQGLWLVNQVCDLAEIRTSARGTTIRLHMSADDGSAHRSDSERIRLQYGQSGR